jgi:ABC-type anion transport system duplicated permease subunit
VGNVSFCTCLFAILKTLSVCIHTSLEIGKFSAIMSLNELLIPIVCIFSSIPVFQWYPGGLTCYIYVLCIFFDGF